MRCYLESTLYIVSLATSKVMLPVCMGVALEYEIVSELLKDFRSRYFKTKGNFNYLQHILYIATNRPSYNAEPPLGLNCINYR